MARLSIKGKLQKARTKGKAVSILTEWSKNYKGQILYVINAMDKAKARGDLRAIGFLIGELTAIQGTLFTGLNSITQQLIQPDLPALDPNDNTPLWTEEEE